jgi:hypothetical protein
MPNGCKWIARAACRVVFCTTQCPKASPRFPYVTGLFCVVRFFALAFIFIAVVITQKDAFNVSHAQKCQFYPLISQSAGQRACPCVCALGDQTVRTSVLAGALTTYVRFQGEEAVSTLRGYIRNTEFKDPVTSEMKSLMNLRDVNDFWNWHEVFLCAGSLGGGVKGSWIEHLSMCASTHTHMHTTLNSVPACTYAITQLRAHANISICFSQ